MIRAALHALRRSRLRFDRVRRALAALDARLDGVRLVEYDPRRLPEIRYSRLNARYQPAVELARLILRAMTVELGPGATAASTFFVDMNVVFEEFVIRALREALRLSAQELIQGASGRPLFLDRARTIALAPDLMWQGGSRCTFVGDVKYKKLYAHAPNADLYQLLAYTIAAGLPAGLLIYAAGEGQPAEHHIVEVGKMIHVVALDLSGSIDEIRTQVERVATLIRELSRQALTPVFAF